MAKSQIRQYVFNATAGTIEVPGKIDLQQLLVITDSTKNVILYNFADSTYVGTTVTFTRANDLNFPSALDNSDGTTIIQLSSACTTASTGLIAANGITSSDVLQILYEQPFQYVRSPEIGTDAFERQRVAAPQSLLDADFEYGMQPTKWLTISQQRQYPAIYEIPGTDLVVAGATTDASSGAGGTSTTESVITITTSVAHGYTVGQPFTIRGFNSAYTGFDRAEGSFVVYTATTYSFTYVAKGKVGYNNGDNILTPFVQLRQGGFYTGSNINAVISVTATATTSTGNLITLTSTTGMVQGSPIIFNAVTTNAIATGQANLAGVTNANFITVGSTIGMYAGMPLQFSGSNFGGLITGTTYYVQATGTNQGIIDSRTVTVVTAQGGSTNPVLTAAVGGNMYIVGGGSFGGLVSGTQYYIATLPGGNQVTVSNNIVYTTNITATNATANYVTFGTTNNMTVGEAVVTGSSSNFGNLTTNTTYYVLQIIDSRNAILTATANGTTPFVVTTATGTFGVTVGASITLTTVTANNGFLQATAVCPPAITYSTPSATATSSASSISGTTLTIGGTVTGTFAIGQGLQGTGILSGTTILSGSGSTWTVSVSQAIGPIAINGIAGQATITVNTTSPHGFTPGDTINVLQSSENGTNNNQLVSGPFFVETTTSNSSFTYTARGPGVITGTISGLVYARPDSFYSHRPFDGGVQLGTGLPAHGSQAIRMSKKYIRYQSGKAINFNTGLLMAPNYFVRNAFANGTSIGSTITIVTDDVDHGCQIGAQVTLSGVVTSGYNGTYNVASIVDERTITVLATQVLGSSTGILGAAISDPCLLSINKWTGASVRSGTYDEQNGVFFQYDGQTVGAVRRSSTFQLAGTVTVIVGSGQIVGINTRFATQLFVGDRVVIRGMSHLVTQVVSDTLMYVNPQYRGYQSLSGIKMTKTVDRVIPQYQWNLDVCDGSNSPFNPSGYLLKPNAMNMVCVQWTWYGAGFIDWMLRGPEGKYITVHRLRNNNLNNEAWMRSGNLPVRYEVINESARTFIVGTQNVSTTTQALGTTDTVIPVFDATNFPVPISSQAVFIDNEIITYTNKISAQATATSATGNTITVTNITNMAVGQPIVFQSQNTISPPLGNLVSGTTYFINTIVNSTTITVSTLYANVGVTPMTQVNATATAILQYMQINALTGCTRAQPLNPWASGGQRTFTAGSAATHNANTGIILINGTASPIVSHWGAAFIEDGGFDSDRSYIFNYSQPNVNISTKKTTAFAIRLAPSVSNALPGDLGARELINRASFLLQTLESSAGSGAGNAALVIEGIINPSNMPAIANIQFASMNSAVNPTGQPSFSQVAPGLSMVFTNAINNFLTVPIYIPANATTIPLTSNPTLASSGTVSAGDDIFFPSSTASLYGLTRVTSLVNTTSVFTSTISSSTTASISTGSISGTTFTATTVGSGSIAVGMVLTGTNVATGTYIVSAIGGGTGSGSTWTVSISQTTPPTAITGTTISATITFTSGSAIATGSTLTGGTIPVNTWITGQISGTAGGTGVYNLVNLAGTSVTTGQNPTGSTYYGITVNQVILASVPLVTGGTTLNFSRSTYALPGETVFSYINAPANKDSLDLTSFKELTNTPIGGRGCYPNGCDILFINAYITQGSPINQNLVLRWGEAQA